MPLIPAIPHFGILSQEERLNRVRNILNRVHKFLNRVQSLFWAVCLSSALDAAAEDEKAIDFNRDIRPIISENCVHCHGPDPETRDAGLRLDTQAGAMEDLGGYQALVPHDLESSEMWYRIMLDADDDELMPPADSKRALTAEQKDLVRRWIESGGEYQEHWAFVAPEREAGHTIDHFIQKQADARQLTLAERAKASAQIRRASLDIIGLPPTPEELDDFLLAYSQDAEAAYASLVDRLLASPRFGERWARQWLDLARYADSNGFQADQLRDSWAYRDWVIDALNDNMPYDRFTIEQLAGDLLPDATLEQKIATGFHRTVTCNVEAGVHVEQNRTNQVVDRVNTTGTVWLGVTMECAQCHDHKYDPFTMREYYQMFAYFNNTPVEVSVPSGKTDVSHDFVGPFMDLPQSPELVAQREQIAAELKAVRAEKKKLDTKSAYTEWQQQMRAEPEWQTCQVQAFESTGGETSEVLADQSVLMKGKFSAITDYRATMTVETPQLARAIRLEVLTHDQLPGQGPGRGDETRTNFVLNELELEIDGQPVELVDAKASFSQNKYDVSGLIDGDISSGWAIAPEYRKDHWATFQLTEPVELSKDSQLQVVLRHAYKGGRTIGRFRVSVLDGIPKSSDMDAELLSILKKQKPSKSEQKKLRAAYEKSSPALAAMVKKEAQLDKKQKALKPDQTLVMQEMDEGRMTRIMKRGNYLDQGDEVQAGTPAVLPAIDPELPANRLGLAQWLVNGENPLVARVAVNRWWAEIFGRGIVATLEDFGTQSEPPTHPELLDWLAIELVESGWDMKHVLRHIFLSETYRQDSRVVDSQVDPPNHFLARAPRFRLEAERIRDNALAVSGLLSTKMHGRPIMPYQPDNIWRQVGRNEPKWIEAKDENRWRRGIYIVYRRAAPYPSMVNFDAPDRGACTVERPRTNTPLQALTMLNDPAYVEMALAFADRILTESDSPSVAARLHTAYRIAFSREALPAEIEHLSEVVAERVEHFTKDPTAAQKTIAGASRVYQAQHSDPAELAAWFYIGNILLNLDEMVTKS